MEINLIHQSEPEPSGAYFKVFTNGEYLIMEGRSTLGEDFQFKTKDAFVVFFKTCWSMATYSMSQYLIRYTNKKQVKFKGDFNVIDGVVKPAMAGVYCLPEYEVWDIRGFLIENGITPNEETLEEAVLNIHSRSTLFNGCINNY